ncbi:MAG: protein kinase, partial [Thermoprotei archaeon]
MSSLKKLIASILRYRPWGTIKPGDLEETISKIIEVSRPVSIIERDPSYRVLENYYVYKPFVKVVIAETEEGPQYFVEEYGLTPSDEETLNKIVEILIDEIKPPS